MGAASVAARPPSPLIGGWEFGLLACMVLLYLAGLYINPAFFGSTSAFFAVLRDSARYGVIAVGVTFIIVNRELDLSVGSTLGLTATLFAVLFAPSHYDLGAGTAIAWCLALGLGIGLINGVMVTVLEVPAFIATLTMLFIGRGLTLGLTGGNGIAFAIKARDYPGLFSIGETNGIGLNNQVLVFAAIALIGIVALGYTRIGLATYATGGNEQAARYAGIPTNWIRMRCYILSGLCASIAGLMNAAQDKGADPSYGLGAELVVIAAVIVGGASILGGRGRMLGSCIGVVFIGLIDKVLREGVPITRIVEVAGEKIEIGALAQLPAGAVPAFLGLILVLAVLIEPWLIRRRVLGRLWARLRRLPMPQMPDLGGIAIGGTQTRGTVAQARGMHLRGLAAFLHRREAAALLILIALWLIGFWARPDFWGGLDNSFSMLLAFSEIALLTGGLTFVMANGDIDLSVGSVLALSAATAAYLMKEGGVAPILAVAAALAMGALAGVINGLLTTVLGMPAFIATLGMFYMARGLAAGMVAGRQLSGFPDNFLLLGRNVFEVLNSWGMAPTSGFPLALAKAVGVQTIFVLLALAVAAVVMSSTTYGQKVYAIGGNERAARYAGINTARVRFSAFVASSLCAACAGVIYIAFYRSFNPTAGQSRELDAIASVIIGGGSVFGGYGTILGSIAGAGVITLIRSLLSLQIRLSNGAAFALPPQWLNVFVGAILIGAVLADIWLRQHNLIGRLLSYRPSRRRATAPQADLPARTGP